MSAWGVDSGHIDVGVREDVCVIILNRPQKLNALTADMRRELAAILRHYGTGETVRGIALTGAGRAFSAGEDLTAAAGLPPGGLIDEVESFHDITRAALQTSIPVVAAVNGIAVGGACEVTLCLDTRIGTPSAEYYLPENRIGLTISNASSLLLPRLVGHRAMRIVLESARLSADQALSIGLLDAIVDPEDLLPAAVRTIHDWTRPGSATAAHLRLLRPPLADVERAFEVETRAAREVEESGIASAGINRFVTRRAHS